MSTTNSAWGGARKGFRRVLLMTGTAIATLTPVLPTVTPQAWAQAVAQSISVPAGPLTAALNSLAAPMGLQFLFDASIAQGKNTRGITGTLTAEQALKAVLAGTGIAARFAGANQVTLQNASSVSGPSEQDSTLLDPILIYGARNAATLSGTTSSAPS